MSASGDTVRVVIADEHHLFRDGLRGVLEQDGMAVVGEAWEGSQAARLARGVRPDVVVLGMNTQGASGAQAVREILAANADVRVVVVTASADGEDALEALGAGACSHLAKDMPAEELAAGIRHAAAGSAVLSRGAMRALIDHVSAGGHDGAEERAAIRTLTPREVEVLRLIVEGADNVAIGRELSISPHTVKHYVTSILEKLGVHSRVEAAVRAVRAGLVQ